MRDFEIVKVLKGHSGCRVELCSTQGQYFINKTAKDASYGPRLARQIEKQVRLARLIPLPEVIEKSLDAVPVQYKMAYVSGLDFRQVCLNRPMSWIDAFVNVLFDTVDKMYDAKINLKLEPLFQSKIRSIEQALYENELCDVGQLNLALTALKNHDFGSVPATESHGDLTMENIIFQSNDAITFIDVLDGELESVWLDIAKLLYDLEIGWSLRESLWRDHHASEERLLSMLSRYLHEEIYLRASAKFPGIVDHITALKAVQALRVLPYSHDNLTADRLTRYITQLFKPTGAQ